MDEYMLTDLQFKYGLRKNLANLERKLELLQNKEYSKLEKEYFEVEFQGERLSISSPTLKEMRQIERTKTTDDMLSSAEIVLNKNRQGKTFPIDQIEGSMDDMTVKALLLKYLDWVYDVKNDPN